MERTGHIRRVDTNGRIIVPSQLRDQLSIRPSDTYEFLIYKADDGRTYLCIECTGLESELQKAKRLLEEAGYKVEG